VNKNTFFTGQPIYSQIINQIPKWIVTQTAKELNSDRYYKKFDTYTHLISILFAAFKNCTSLREIEFGMSACHQKMAHLGINYIPARSTLSEANANRNPEVFEQIYYKLFDRFRQFLPDSRIKNKDKKLYIIDSTTVTLFQEIMGSVGRKPIDGKRKGGFKVHTLIKADEDVPMFIKIGKAANHDSTFLKYINLPPGSLLTFDKGYVDYTQYQRLTQEKIWFVTRLRTNAVWTLLKEKAIDPQHKEKGVIFDKVVEIGHHHNNSIQRVKTRIIEYKDPLTKRVFTFLTNNMHLTPLRVAQIYQKRWQIELLFKRIKQNYPLQYFLGDNENAIKIQTWCSLIADLLTKVIKAGVKRNWSYSCMVSVIRQNLMEYVSLIEYLKNPEKILNRYRQRVYNAREPDLFTNLF
jgi:IS4 transposase